VAEDTPAKQRDGSMHAFGSQKVPIEKYALNTIDANSAAITGIQIKPEPWTIALAVAKFYALDEQGNTLGSATWPGTVSRFCRDLRSLPRDNITITFSQPFTVQPNALKKITIAVDAQPPLGISGGGARAFSRRDGVQSPLLGVKVGSGSFSTIPGNSGRGVTSSRGIFFQSDCILDRGENV
jgi:hypothetical protein